MTRPAQGFKIQIVIGTPMCLWSDMVNGLCVGRSAIAFTFLAEMLVALEYAGSPRIPVATITALMPAQSVLMLLPPFIKVIIAITRAVYGCFCASVFTACSRYSLWHPVSTPGGVLCVVCYRGAAQPVSHQHGQRVSSMGKLQCHRMHPPLHSQQANHDSIV